MKDLVEYIVKQLVTTPDAVTVEETTDGTQVNLLLRVDPKDMGIVIGKAGQTIKSIRKLLLVKAISDGVRVNLQLFDESRPERESSDVSSQSSESSEEAAQKTSEKSEDQSVGEPESSEVAEPDESAEIPSPTEDATSETPQEETPKE